MPDFRRSAFVAQSATLAPGLFFGIGYEPLDLFGGDSFSGCGRRSQPADDDRHPGSLLWRLLGGWKLLFQIIVVLITQKIPL